jgi:hypothetical protein
MSEHSKSVDVTTSTELQRVAEQVQKTRQPVRLTRDGRVVAVVQPAPAARQARPGEPATTRVVPQYPTLESLAGAAGTLPEPRPWRDRRAGRPMTFDDPLFQLIGSVTDAPPTDSSKKYEYLADAIAPKQP